MGRRYLQQPRHWLQCCLLEPRGEHPCCELWRRKSYAIEGELEGQLGLGECVSDVSSS